MKFGQEKSRTIVIQALKLRGDIKAKESPRTHILPRTWNWLVNSARTQSRQAVRGFVPLLHHHPLVKEGIWPESERF